MQAPNGLTEPQGLTPGLPLIAYVCWKTLSHSSKPQSLFCEGKFFSFQAPSETWRDPFSKLKTTLNVSLLKHDRSLENSLEDEVKTNLWQLLMGNPN